MRPLPWAHVTIPSFISTPAAYVVFGNPLDRWALALAIVAITALLASLLLRIGTRLLKRLAAHTRSRVDDALVAALSATRLWLVALVAAEPAAHTLDLSEGAVRVVHDVAVVAFFLQVGLWAACLIEIWISGTRKHARETNPAALTSFGAISFIVRVAAWALVALLAFENLGVNVSALVAGLGIGGIAIGLALQNILGDLFASLSIVLDKPFVVGDFIIVDDFMGTVDSIGVKTTRVRSLGGELLVFANGDLTRSRLRNYKRMAERRVLFGFGVRYETTPEQVEAIPGIVKEIIQAQPRTRFDRAHFKGFGASSLDFEVVYWVLTPDYNPYMDIQQAINLALMRRLAERHVDFAFPSQTLYFDKPLRVTRHKDETPPGT
jgi:small-conductance mechanosensitive channel